jgi:hypothetical protein
MTQQSWKGPLGREYWENKAKQAWVDLGNPQPNPSPVNPTQNDLDYDAFRHAYTSALWTHHFSELVARLGGDHIERQNRKNFTSEKGLRDMRGDLLNNAKGREIGKNAGSDWSDEKFAQAVLDALKDGSLVINKQTDWRTLSENFPQDLNVYLKDTDSNDTDSNDLDLWLGQLKKDLLDALIAIGNELFELAGIAGLAGTTPPRLDPLVLDLDGDGIETTSTRDGTVILFDHDADGVKTGTGWVKPDDAWLVLDRNGNDTIDSGRELFGVDTIKSNGQLATDGFDALKDLDANQDGKIDSADSVFANLRIWRDLNQDGISQANELTTLAANNIIGIDVNASAVRTDLGNGNVQTAAGTFTRSNGTTGATGETNGAASLGWRIAANDAHFLMHA